MNEITTYHFDNLPVRTLTINDEPWFVGKDVAEILGYANHRDALSKRVDDEDKMDGVAICDSIGREQTPTFINESGLYSLILSSKLPDAKKFKRWVTAEVLPAVHKHGGYLTPEKVEEALLNPDTLIRLATDLKHEREQRLALETQITADRPKALFAEAVTASSTSILIGELAKLLKQNGVNIGQNRMFVWMRENGYLISRKGTDYNMPTQRAMELGLFSIKETTITHADGHIMVSKTPKVTGKGQQYFIEKFLGSHGQCTTNDVH